MSTFRFKKFNIVNERSAMKVNTDGVLLGAAMTLASNDKRLLDIGTGTGTIALMAAQRLSDIAIASDKAKNFCITAIDIDKDSAEEAAANFSSSPWGDHLTARHTSLEQFASSCIDKFDLIFSNPPYFDNALQAPENRRNAARHTSEGLSYREILEFASEHLSEDGKVALVLPSDSEQDLTRHARMCGLHLFSIMRIRTVPRKSPSRIIAEFSRLRTATPEEAELTIQDKGTYTPEYLALMKPFYLFA